MRGGVNNRQKKSMTRKEAIFLVMAFVVCGLSLLNTFKIPYTGDDRINSLTKGALGYYDQSLLDHTLQVVKSWLSTGRFLPFSFTSYTFFALFSSLFSYRLFLFLLNFAAISAFGAFVYQLTKKWEVVSFSVITTTIFFQYRYYHDAILGYHGLMQTITILFFLCLLFQLKSIETNQFKYNVASGVVFFVSLFVYEIAYFFIVVFLIVVFLYKKGKERIRFIQPHVIAFFAAGIPTVILRLTTKNISYEGTSFSFQPEAVLTAFLKQVSAVIPLSYLKVIHGHIQNPLWTFPALYHFILFPLFFCTALFCCLYFLRKKNGLSEKIFFTLGSKKREKDILNTLEEEKENQNHSFPSWEKVLFLIGLVTCTAPAAIISLSERYQEELIWGVGYLPVYIQSFGAACTMSSLCFLLLKRLQTCRIKNFHSRRDISVFKRSFISKILCVVISFAASCVLFLTVVVNQTTIAVIVIDAVQSVAEYTAEHNLFDQIPDQARLIVVQGGGGPDYEPESFVYQNANGLKITPVKLYDLEVENADQSIIYNGIIKSYPENLYGFYAEGTLENGFAAVFRIDEIDYIPEKQEIKQVYTKEMRCIYVGYDSGKTMIVSRLDKNQNLDVVYANLSEMKNMEGSVPLYKDSGGDMVSYSDFEEKLAVMRIGDVKKAPGGLKELFYPEQGDSFMFELHSEEIPILVRNISFG